MDNKNKTELKVTREIAERDVNDWLDFKKVGLQKRISNKDQIEGLIDAVSEGTLLLKEDKVFVHTLKFPIGSEQVTDKFEYQPRIKLSQVQTHLQHVKGSDSASIITAYIAALTGKPSKLIGELDSEDSRIAQNIALFFL